MEDNAIQADSFLLKPYDVRIYRVRQQGSGTVLWFSRRDMLRYLEKIYQERLQAKKGR